MRRTHWFLLLCCVALIHGCRKSADDPARNANQRRIISPRTINLAGITFYKSSTEFNDLLHSLRCEQKDSDIKVCRWSPRDKVEKESFAGVDQIKFTFFRDSVQSIQIQYAQMLDVEYRNFEKALRDKYAYAVGDQVVDTTGTDWQYDSLGVTLTPNRKQHWTGTVFTFSPVLEFQEHAVYRRWLESLEKKKVRTIY